MPPPPRRAVACAPRELYVYIPFSLSRHHQRIAAATLNRARKIRNFMANEMSLPNKIWNFSACDSAETPEFKLHSFGGYGTDSPATYIKLWPIFFCIFWWRPGSDRPARLAAIVRWSGIFLREISISKMRFTMERSLHQAKMPTQRVRCASDFPYLIGWIFLLIWTEIACSVSYVCVCVLAIYGYICCAIYNKLYIHIVYIFIHMYVHICLYFPCFIKYSMHICICTYKTHSGDWLSFM